MIKLAEIYERVQEYDAEEKKRKEARRERVRAMSYEGAFLGQDEEDEEEEEAFHHVKDFAILREYEVPPFAAEDPNPHVPGAAAKHRKRFGKYLAFVDAAKAGGRSKRYCTVLPLATTSSVLLRIWGSDQLVSKALKELVAIGLIRTYDDYYQTGVCKTYAYFVENEAKLVEYCEGKGIPKFVPEDEQKLTKAEEARFRERCEKVYTEDFRKSVAFKSRTKLARPTGVGAGAFVKDLREMLYENYPGLRHYQRLAHEINERFYKDEPEFRISFRPKFHWNDAENPKGRRSYVNGIGIRAANSLCSAKKGDEVVGSEDKRAFRSQILDRYGFNFEKDITSSVPRVAYALNHGGWLKESVDLYRKIYEEYDPSGGDFDAQRDAIKGLFFRAYFDTTDNKLGWHVWDKMVQDGATRDEVYAEMAKLRRAMERVLGAERHDNYVFFVESCIYIDVLYVLLSKGYKVWLVFDCFYGNGFGSQEEFARTVECAVWACFVRYKMASDYDEWESLFDGGESVAVKI